MIEEISFGGWKRNLRLQGRETELIITLDVGPRLIHCATPGGKNVFVEMPGQMGSAGERGWMIRGGHRFWTAPEADHSYDLDNSPVEWKKLGENALEVAQPAGGFGFQKTLRVELLGNETVRVTHLLANRSGAPLDVTPWALSVMAPGGTAIIPQPRLDLHPTEFPEGRDTKPEEYLPNRELILWPFTNLSDGRYVFGENFLYLSHHVDRPATKIGLKLTTGWIAYQNGGTVFAKHFAREASAPYPDRGANCELFTNREIFELESLAPQRPLAPGETREHVEHWVVRTAPDLRDETAALEFFAKLPAV
jgi:hypothetical protein